MKQDYPSLYRRIQEKANAGQFLPVGGTWIEMVIHNDLSMLKWVVVNASAMVYVHNYVSMKS